jgi:hypothetical protein
MPEAFLARGARSTFVVGAAPFPVEFFNIREDRLPQAQTADPKLLMYFL